MSATPGKRILIVDDDSAVVDYLCESLAAEGYSPVGTTSSVEALARVTGEDFDLVITDVEMPELRGVDLLQAIQEVKPTQMVLFITAYGSVEMAVAAVRAVASGRIGSQFHRDRGSPGDHARDGTR